MSTFALEALRTAHLRDVRLHCLVPHSTNLSEIVPWCLLWHPRLGRTGTNAGGLTARNDGQILAMRMSQSSAERVLRVAAFGYALSLAAAILYANRAFYHDDAYITLRYARNLITGAGAVWNPGEYVQGYTNFLHLMLVSLLGALGMDLVLASRIVGLAAFVALVVFMLAFGSYCGRQGGARLWHLPAIFVMTSAPMLVWSVGGLEGTVFSLLVAAGCLLFLVALDSPDRASTYSASGVCLGLSFLARPDGIVFISLSALWLLFDGTKGSRTNRLLAFLVPVASIIVPYVIWQWLYYGDIVPNTFYAKTGAPLGQRLESGISYVVDYAFRPTFLPLLMLASLIHAVATKRWSPKLAYLTLAVASYLGFIVFVGGDHMQAFRLLLPMVALMSVVLTLALSTAITQQGYLAVGGITIAALIFASLQLSEQSLNPRGQDPAAFVGAIVGKHIANAWPEDSLIALSTAGSTPYFADRHRYIDMLGLNDSHIAKRRVDELQLPWQHAPGHLKGDGAYVLDRRPDFIILGPAEGTVASNPWFLSDLELAQDARFDDEYSLSRVELDRAGRRVEQGGLVFTYYRRTRDR